MHQTFNTATNELQITNHHHQPPLARTQSSQLSHPRLILNGHFLVTSPYAIVGPLSRMCRLGWATGTDRVQTARLKPRKPADRVLEVNCSVTYQLLQSPFRPR